MKKRMNPALLLLALCAPAFGQVAADAVVTRAYDGDTLSVEAAIWPNLNWTGSVRVVGVDTPEIRGKCDQEKAMAVAARDYVRDLLVHKTVRLTHVEDDKYGGRVAAKVYFWEGDGWVELAGRLIDLRLGRSYSGGTRESWCEESNEIQSRVKVSDMMGITY